MKVEFLFTGDVWPDSVDSQGRKTANLDEETFQFWYGSISVPVIVPGVFMAQYGRRNLEAVVKASAWASTIALSYMIGKRWNDEG